MSVSTQPHMRLEGEIPVPCGCQLGYHHTPGGEPLVEHDEDGEVVRRAGRHPYCVGVCKVWGTPTEEFDFVFTRGERLGERRIALGIQVVDLTLPEPRVSPVSWDDDAVRICETVGLIRMAEHKRRETA